MPISSNTRRAILGMVLAAAATGSIVQAQGNAAGRPLPVPPPGGPQGDIVIKCCRCLGQESGTVNISTGTAPWRVSSVLSPEWPTLAPTGPVNPSPMMVPGVISNPHPNWTTALSPTPWLQPSASTSMAMFNNGHVTYKLKIRIPNCTIKQRVTISGQVAADDLGKMFIDGPGSATSPIAFTPPPPATWPGAGFGTAAVMNFNHVLTAPGTYVIRVEVDNKGGGPLGMVLRGTANGKCDDRVEKGKDDRAEDCKDC
jgi:hypothetical protein